MIVQANIWSALKDRANNDIFDVCDSGAPTNGVTGAGICGPGSMYINTANGVVYRNSNTKASPTWSVQSVSSIGGDVTISSGGTSTIGANKVLSTMLATNVLQRATGTIAAADIIGTGAGQLGHANGVVLLAPPGAGISVEFVSAVMILDFGVAAYTGGGNTYVAKSGGTTQISSLTSAGNGIGAGADSVSVMVPLAVSGNLMPDNIGLNLVAAAAFTNPGTATGVVRWVLNYRLHANGL